MAFVFELIAIISPVPIEFLPDRGKKNGANAAPAQCAGAFAAD